MDHPLHWSYLISFKNYISDALLDVYMCENLQTMYYLVELTVTEFLENEQYF